MIFDDGYGDVTPVEDFIADCEDWLARFAGNLTRSRPSRFDDVRQEGRIALWRHYRDLEGASERVPHAMQNAKRRMIAVAFPTTRQGHLTGHTGVPGHQEAIVAFSMDELLAEGIDILLGAVQAPEGVEMAYHDGEIQQALAALTPRQYRYVYARFWCGMDPTDGLSMNPGMREARGNNPDLRRDVLWTGNRTTAGAKRTLAEALAHLAPLGGLDG